MISITVDPANPSFSSSEGMLFNKDATLLLRCPGGKTGHVVISEGTAVGAGAFQNALSIEGITLPASTTAIVNSMFENCQSLRAFVIPEILTSIRSRAFTFCYALEEMDIPDTVVSIGDTAVNDGLPTPTGSWLVSHDLPYDRDLSTDADGSGTDLLLAYALDLDPNENPGPAVPRAVIDGAFLTLTYRAQRSGITYLPQVSENLGGWGSEGIIIGEADANGFRTARFPLGGVSRFMRLMVTQSPPP